MRFRNNNRLKFVMLRLVSLIITYYYLIIYLITITIVVIMFVNVVLIALLLNTKSLVTQVYTILMKRFVTNIPGKWRSNLGYKN